MLRVHILSKDWQQGSLKKRCKPGQNFEVLGKCHFLPGEGAPENWGDQVLFLRSKGGSKDFFKLKRGITYIF